MISFALFALLPALVSAHGFPQKVVIDGTTYQGNNVGSSPTISSAIRQIDTNSPVKGASNPNLNCGQNAQLAADSATAHPGSNVDVYWVGGTTGSSPWPHNVGPVMHYMTKCDGSCSSYNSSNAQWFKIAEQGVQSGNTWYQAQLQSGKPVSVTVPSNLAAGNYLLRSEIITLQLAMTQGGAEFYPACIQLTVDGSQTGQPSSSDQVMLPGAYKDTDPGILVDVYNGPMTNYVFPGPPVASFISSGGSGGSTSGSGSGSSSAPVASSSTPTSTLSESAAPSAPVNVGGYAPSSAASTTAASPTSTGGSSTCMRRRSRSPVVESKRMHRRRNRTSH